MKKIIFIITLLFISFSMSMCGESDNNDTTNTNESELSIPDIYDNLEPNQYVYYHYNVSDINTYIGLLYISEKDFLLRIIDRNTSKEMNIMMTIDKTDDGYDINPNYTQGIDDDYSEQLFTTIFTLLMNIQERYRRIDVDKYPEDILITEKMEDEFEHRFSFWIPIFNLNYLLNKSENKYVLKLIKFGSIDDVEDFLNFNDVPKSDMDGPDLNISEMPLKSIKIYSSEISLDDNWEEMDNEKIKGIGYQMSIKSNMDAQINFEEVILNDENYILSQNLMKNILIYMQSITYTYPETIEVKKINNNLAVCFKAKDNNTNYNNYFIISIREISEYELNVFTFSCFYLVYENNKEYFNKIINSVK